MASLDINRVTNANIYINGTSFLGKAQEVELPQLKYIMQDHNALGMVGNVELPAGVDKLEAKIKWTSVYSDTLAKISNPYEPIQLQVRASVEVYDSSARKKQLPFVAMLTVNPKEFQLGSFKARENVETETSFTCTYVQVKIDNVEMVEFDVLANIFKINGKDILTDYKNNIGA